MRIILHSGTAQGVIASLRAAVRVATAGGLTQAGLLAPAELLGADDRLTPAVLLAARQHPLAAQAGLLDPIDHHRALAALRETLAASIRTVRPKTLWLSLPEAAGWLDSPVLLRGLAELLSAFSDDIRPVLHVADPATALCNLYLAQVGAGRATGLEDEAQVARDPAGWWAAAQAMQADRGGLGPAAAVDARGLVALWVEVFGADAVLARALPAGPVDAAGWAELRADLDLTADLAVSQVDLRRPSVAALGRMLAVNAALAARGADYVALPGALRAGLLARCQDDGPPLEPASLSPLTALLGAPTGVPVPVIRPDSNFDAETLLADLPQALEAWHAARQAAADEPAHAVAPPHPGPRRRGPAIVPPLSPAAEVLLTPQAREVLKAFAGTAYWPENRRGAVDETAAMPPFSATPGDKTGALIVACMKNEGPYILEWVAYHLAIGVGHFLIFTNDCSDGTTEILDRLSEMGHVTRCDNEVWKGKSPQQHALNVAVKMEVVKASDWLIHIDVDEYINIRIGDGTMIDLIAAMGPEATNLAMTWRLFGNGGVDDIGDAAVMARFTGCSPNYCPKPHTIWGFKTMTRNNGAYAKLSCHRPNKWDQTTPVNWVNGSMQDTTRAFREKGWRSSIGTVGFDAVQLNHYALRSRASFLIKRQRGRALHVDRSIGLNYWVRHDWNQNQDRTILRQLPRMQAMRAALLSDPVLAQLHADSLAWHDARARELREIDMFRELWDQTAQAELTDPERVAYAAAAGMES